MVKQGDAPEDGSTIQKLELHLAKGWEMLLLNAQVFCSVGLQSRLSWNIMRENIQLLFKIPFYEFFFFLNASLDEVMPCDSID